MTDADLLALCIWSEAANQPYDGMCAVGRVVRNRMALHYQSDGTMQGTVLHRAAFSGFSYAMVNGKYVKVAFTPEDMQQRAETMLAKATQQHVWPQCQDAAIDSDPAVGYVGGTEYEKLTPKTVLYANLAISQPNWATLENEVCQIGAHTFFVDPSLATVTV